jgi:hypothetical protein
LVGLRNKLADGQDRLKTVGKEGYMRMAAEVDTYKVSLPSFLYMQVYARLS